jgi:hypothetical protein
METKELAKGFFMERLKAYLINNPGGFPGTQVVNEWYPQCVELAEAIVAIR